MLKKLTSATAILLIAGCGLNPAGAGVAQYFATANGPVEFEFPAGWYQDREGPYDLQCTSGDEQMTTGIFLFLKADLADDLTAPQLLELQIDDLRSKRQNFQVLEAQQTVQLPDKQLTTVVFSGEKNLSKYYYKFTLVEFAKHPEFPVVMIQVAIPSEWARQKPILEGITRSGRVSTTEPAGQP